jgi:thiamine pyrophosphate-dependent acetolactate synthase large subunit-like protein
MSGRTVADYIISFLASIGVEHVYGYPGSPLVPLLAAIQRQDRVKWILMRHENAAALAASASAKRTGRLGVCVLTSGPGALQAVCGIADANLDRAPVLALTGLVARSQQGHWDFQDVDQTSLYGSILAQSLSCSSASQVVALLRKLSGYALHQQAAAHLAMPVDVLAEIIPDDAHFNVPDQQSLSPRITPQISDDDVSNCILALTNRKPVLVVGSRAVGAGAQIERLAVALKAPIIAAFEGKGIIDESHPHYLGVLGIFGHPAVAGTREIVESSDIVLSFGVDNLKPFLSSAKNAQRRSLICCTPDIAGMNYEYAADITLIGNLSSIADRIADRLPPGPRSDVIETLSLKRLETMTSILESLPNDHDPLYTNTLDFLLQLNPHLNVSHNVVVDTGSHALWVALFLRLRHRQRYVVSSRLGTMGFSLPAAIALQLADPLRKTIAICGDGGFGMVGMEIATAVQYRLPIVVIVINNGVLQNVMAQQAIPFGITLHNPDFVAFAKSFGADGTVIDGQTDVDAVLQKAFNHRDGPFLIDVRVSPSILAPLNKWETG